MRSQARGTQNQSQKQISLFLCAEQLRQVYYPDTSLSDVCELTYLQGLEASAMRIRPQVQYFPQEIWEYQWS